MKFPLADAVQSTDSNNVITQALNSVRNHLDMDFSYLSEFSGDDIVFREVSHIDELAIVRPGDRMEQHRTYCSKVASGALPQLIQDTSEYSSAQDIQVTHEIPIRSHISVPIKRRNGDLHGMFCCFSRKPNPTLNQRDLDIVTMFAGIVSHTINDQLEADEARKDARDEISELIESDGLETFLQPVVSLRDNRPVAFEALTRFEKEPHRGPLWWFDKATKADMQVTLEMEAIERAIRLLPRIPEPIYLSVNASPLTMSSVRFLNAMEKIPPNRMFVELTEHEEIAETAALMSVIGTLRRNRIGIAVDDVGAGYAGLSTILRLNPNVLKLDRSLVDGIHKDKAKQSLTTAMLEFAHQMGAFLIAEGVEEVTDDMMLRSLGARLGQGYLYSRPASAREHLDRLRTNQQTQRAS